MKSTSFTKVLIEQKEKITVFIKEIAIMTIIELYSFLLPFINFLGTICLIALVAGGALFTIAWIIKRFWKYILTFSTISFVIFIAVLIFGAM